VTGGRWEFPTAKALYDFLQDRAKKGETLWKIKRKKAKGAKAGAYGMRTQYDLFNWIPRAGEVGSVARAEVKEYLTMEGISTWHRFVATGKGELCVSRLSCFCSACQDQRWGDCPFIADTGKVTVFTPEQDMSKIKTEWTVQKSVEVAPKLKKTDWVIFHVSKKTKANRNLFWDQAWGLGKYVGGSEGVTVLTGEGTMVKIQPYRTSQLGDGVFLEQSGTTSTVDIRELLMSGLEIKVNVKKSISNMSKRAYADKCYAPGDKKGGCLYIAYIDQRTCCF
jgi:hypothetical protein